MSVPSVVEVDDLEEPGAEAVVEARLTLLGLAVDAPQVLGRYTDEELAALAGVGSAPLAPSPWFGSLSEDEQQTAVTAALRGLTARGVYRAVPVDATTGEFAYQAAPELLALLSMRQFTGTVVVAERRLAEQRDWAVLYRQRAGLWLTEYVTFVGQHEFVLSTDEDAAQALTAWSGAPVDVPAPAFDVTLTREQVAQQDVALEPVGRSTVALTLTRLEIAGSVDESWSGVFTGPQGSYLSVAVDDDVRYHGTDRDGVLTHWRDLLGVA